MNDLSRAQQILRFIAALFFMGTVYSTRAQDFDLPRLMQALATSPATQVAFTEKKFSTLLSVPVVSTGNLIYRRPDIVEKHIDTPRKESYRFTGDELVLRRSGSEKRIPLSSQPLLSAFAASLRGVLGGDLVLLRGHYQLALQGLENSWRLDMTPIDEETGRYVQRISVSGQGGKIAQIEVRETSGDHSVLQIR